LTEPPDEGTLNKKVSRRIQLMTRVVEFLEIARR
jgi:hypothetical protein